MEIERKWMVKGWPEGLPLREEFAMRQGYISVRPTVRIREEALTGGRTDYILCFKSGGGLAREEIERSIDKALFEDLEHKIIDKPLIPKLRRSYTLPDGSVLEVNHVDEGQPTEFWYAQMPLRLSTTMFCYVKECRHTYVHRALFFLTSRLRFGNSTDTLF